MTRVDKASQSDHADFVRFTNTMEGLTARVANAKTSPGGKPLHSWNLTSKTGVDVNKATTGEVKVNREEILNELAREATYTGGKIPGDGSYGDRVKAKEMYDIQRLDAASQPTKDSAEDRNWKQWRIQRERIALEEELVAMVGKATQEQINLQRQKIRNLDFIK